VSQYMLQRVLQCNMQCVLQRVAAYDVLLCRRGISTAVCAAACVAVCVLQCMLQCVLRCVLQCMLQGVLQRVTSYCAGVLHRGPSTRIHSSPVSGLSHGQGKSLQHSALHCNTLRYAATHLFHRTAKR